MNKILFILITNFANNFCMQQALALRDYYGPQQVAKELLPSLKLPTNAEIYTRTKLRNSDKKSYSPADVFDLLKKAKVKFNLSVNLDFLLPKCAICCEDLTEETVASSSDKFVCAGHSERFCTECLSNTLLDKCPICRNLKPENYSPKNLMFKASAHGRKDIIKKLILEQHINVNIARSSDTITPLMLATDNGHIPSIKLLINSGAYVNATAHGYYNMTALHIACSQGHDNIVRFLISKGANVNASETIHHTPLMLAAQEGHLTTVQLLIDNGANVNAVAQNFYNTTALYQACQCGYTNIAKILIANGANVNAKKADDFTPLMIAAQQGHFTTAQLLMDKGANVNAIAQGFNNITALHQVCQNGHTNIAELLISKGANINATRADSYTPLMLAAQEGHFTTVQLLIDQGANVNAIAQGFNNTTALHQACQNGHTRIAALLIANGADINATKTDGFTPLMLARQNGHQDICILLEEPNQNICCSIL